MVGKKRAKFNVHQSRLQQTAFFRQHGTPPSKAEKEERTAAAFPLPNPVPNISSLAAHENTEVKEEEAAEVVEVPEQHSGEPKLIDYCLDDKFFHEPKSFDAMIKWLYHEGPPQFKTYRDCRVALKTYCLARFYDAFGLQNLLLDRFREYFAEKKIKFDDLNYIINKLGDDPSASPLTRYLIAQVAFEIAENGFAEFSKDNWFMEKYLVESDRKIRLTLFEFVAHHAEHGKGEDPAAADYNWHVVADGDHQRYWDTPGGK